MEKLKDSFIDLQKQMANQWFKFYGGEYLSDPKIDRLSPVERSCWITLLCLASMNDDDTIKYLTVEVLLNKSGVQYDPYHPEEWEKGLGVLHKFNNMEMIEMDDDGTIRIKNWRKRQETALTAAERSKTYRERLKQAERHENVTERVTNVTLEENRREENRKEDINNIRKSVAFAPPTLEEVKNYCQERNNGVNPDKWHDFYSSKGWMVGKNKMKDWKAAVRTWEDKKENNPPNREEL